MICATSGILGLTLDACQGDNGGPLIREVSTTQGGLFNTDSSEIETETGKIFPKLRKKSRHYRFKKLFSQFLDSHKLIL